MIYLKDKFNDRIINLCENQTFEFYHDPMNNNDRFRVLFNPSENVLNEKYPDSYFSVFTVGDQVHIIRNSTEDLSGQVYLYTITGQKIHEEPLDMSQQSSISVQVPTGYYILYIVTNQYVYNKKLLIIN
jgi:hypothetical protein